jgi:hypothetical protein
MPTPRLAKRDILYANLGTIFIVVALVLGSLISYLGAWWWKAIAYVAAFGFMVVTQEVVQQRIH